MKKKLSKKFALSLVLGLSFTTLIACNDEPIIENDDQISIRLVVDSSKVKKEYTEGDEFTSANLLVYEVTNTNGQETSRVLTSDYTLSITDGTILKATDREVVVRSNKENVRSSSFQITVTALGSGVELMEVINNILEDRTYTVNSSVSYYDGLRKVTGRVVDIDEYQGVSWTGDTSGMYQDSDAGLGEGRQIGYGSYDERTFQYVIDENGQLTNPRFIDEMEGRAHDAGLFNYFDSRDNFDSLLSTFNIFYGLEIYDLASYEMEYLSTLEPLEGSTYRFTFNDKFTSSQDLDGDGENDVVTLDHAWIIGLIGDVQSCRNIYNFFSRGYIDVTTTSDGGLTIETHPSDDEHPSITSTVSAIGETSITELQVYLEDPDFGIIEDTYLEHMASTFTTYGNELIIYNATDSSNKSPIGVINLEKYIYNFPIEGTVNSDSEGITTGTIYPITGSLELDYFYITESSNLEGIEVFNQYYLYDRNATSGSQIILNSNATEEDVLDTIYTRGINPSRTGILIHPESYFTTVVTEGEEYSTGNRTLPQSSKTALLRLLGLTDTYSSISSIDLSITSGASVTEEVYTFTIHGTRGQETNESVLGVIEFSGFNNATLPEADALYNTFNGLGE